MSQENVNVVRQAWDAHARHENESAFRLYDPQIEIHDGLGVVYRGVVGVREFFREYFEVMVDRSVEIEEWIDAGDEVIAVMHSWGRGKRSGVPVESHSFHVWTVREGKLARLRIYQERSEALEAVGLEE